MIDLLFVLNMILSVFLAVVCVTICALLIAGGYAVIRGIKEGLQQSKAESEKDG